jgi:hypothetical protein
MAAGSSSVLIPGLFSGCDAQQISALDSWRGPDPVETDIRIIVLSYALLAPNPHNKQSWIIDLKSPESFDLYVDPKRLLPDTDPPFRQIHIGQGTFLENLDLAAGHFGYSTHIDYFPQGLYDNNVLENKPVAFIQLLKSTNVSSDPLFASIVKRQSNMRVFSNVALSDVQLESIRAVVPLADTDRYLTVTTDLQQRKKLAEFATRAMTIEVANRQRNEESINMFRFNDDELNRFRDGFGVPQRGADGIKKYLIEHLLISRKAFLAEGSSFAAQSIEGTRDQAESAAAFGWLVSKGNSRLDQVKVGRIYNRINLTATAVGVAMRPMSQVLQEYTDMAALQKEFKAYLQIPAEHTVQMFFRLGIAEPTRPTARRRLSSLFTATTT